ncbi:MAG TPA: glutathione S-transferase [Thermohalobaculum sp.]|nr:glutathione S-transferase [Thermohalobaculum sp.]
MKLYHSETSPYVRKVMVVLHMTGQLGAVELVPGSGSPLAPNDETVGANPLGKVPCLVTDGGEALFDSRVITRWLDHVGQGGLYPAGDALFRVLTLEALADGILDAALLVVYEGRLRPEELRFTPWVEGQTGKVLRALAVLEARVADDLMGAPTMAHVAVGCALGYVDFRLPQLAWRDTCPALADWYRDFAEKPYMQATVPQA